MNEATKALAYKMYQDIHTLNVVDGPAYIEALLLQLRAQTLDTASRFIDNMIEINDNIPSDVLESWKILSNGIKEL